MHVAAFKILKKYSRLYPFAEVIDPLPFPLHLPSPAFPLFLFYEMSTGSSIMQSVS